MIKRIFACFCLSFTALIAWGEEVQVAVGANFTGPMQKIAAQFEQDTGHKIILSFGATGKFYAQIKNGAPFDVFLSADDDTPAKLEQDALALGNTHFTYAIGKLVLWSASSALIDAHQHQGDILKSGHFLHLALANPKLAPYGQAAIETLVSLGQLSQLQPRLVMADNISQAFQFVNTGNAELGFVAMSQVYENGQLKSGSAWIIPGSLYKPIRQDAIVLQKAKNNPGAHALINFLKTEKIKQLIQSYGYDVP